MGKEGQKKTWKDWIKKRRDNLVDHLLVLIVGALIFWIAANSYLIWEGGVTVITAKIDIFWIGLTIIIFSIITASSRKSVINSISLYFNNLE